MPWVLKCDRGCQHLQYDSEPSFLLMQPEGTHWRCRRFGVLLHHVQGDPMRHETCVNEAMMAEINELRAENEKLKKQIIEGPQHQIVLDKDASVKMLTKMLEAERAKFENLAASKGEQG